MRRCWMTASIVIAILIGIHASAGIAADWTGQSGSTRAQAATLSDSVFNKADRDGTAASRSAQNNSAQKQAQSTTGQDGNAANGIGQNGTGQEQAKPSKADESSFLIARRELNNPLFSKSVILMLPLVDTDGVVGLIVNRPTKITLHELFPKIAAYKDGTAVAYFGGPVDVKTGGVLFRSTKAYKEAFHLTGDLYVSFNSDIIEKVLKKPKEVTDVRFFLGRSQWGNEQLAAEMERGSWFGEKEANSAIFRRDSVNVWIELIGGLEPGNVAEWNSGDEGGKRQKGSFASLRMTTFYFLTDQSSVGAQTAKATAFR